MFETLKTPSLLHYVYSQFVRDFLSCRMTEISGSASKEYSLEKAMEKMKSEWSDMLFDFTPYRDSVRFVCLPLSCLYYFSIYFRHSYNKIPYFL